VHTRSKAVYVIWRAAFAGLLPGLGLLSEALAAVLQDKRRGAFGSPCRPQQAAAGCILDFEFADWSSKPEHVYDGHREHPRVCSALNLHDLLDAACVGGVARNRYHFMPLLGLLNELK
jgi:hypothetical protein